MPFNLGSIIAGRQVKPPRIVLVGMEKIGKSTFGSQSPAPVFIQVKGESGLDMLDAPRMPPIERYEDLRDVFAALADEPHEYRTVVIDSFTTLEPMILEYACRSEGVSSVTKLGGGYGAQEAVLVGHTRRILDSLDYLRDKRGMGCILICHTKPNPKQFNDPETEPYDSWKVELRDSNAGAVYRWADAILFASYRKYTRPVGDGQQKHTHATATGERVLYTEKRPAFTAGCRYPGIPFELPLSYPAFHAEYLKAMAGAANG